jgi:hypothetical protein
MGDSITDNDITTDQTTSLTQERERTFSQDDLNRIVAKRNKDLLKELEARPTSEQYNELREKLEALIEDKELQGKTEIEKIRHSNQRELEKLTAKVAQYDEQMKAKDLAIAEAQKKLQEEAAILQRERLSRAFSAALQKAEVVSVGANDALMILLNELREPEISERGVRASYGKDLIDEVPEVIAKKFLQEHPHYASVRGGGAGTTMPNGQPLPRNLADLSQDELFELAGPFPKQ